MTTRKASVAKPGPQKLPARRLRPDVHAGGRPTDYRPEYCELVVETMSAGYSLTAFAGTVGVSRQTINDWMGAHPEFLGACTRAKAARLVHWEGAALRVAERGGGPGTAQIITFAMRNMAPDDYSETQRLEHSGKDGKALQIVIAGKDADL